MKICFGSQIHRISKFPDTYKDLVDKAVATYSEQLPSKWGMYYIDNEGDRVMLCNQEDYAVMLETLPKDLSKVLKVYIVPLEKNGVPIFDFDSANKGGNVSSLMEESKSQCKPKDGDRIEEISMSKDSGIEGKHDTIEGGPQDEDPKKKLQEKIDKIKEKLGNPKLTEARQIELLQKKASLEEKLQRRIEKEEKLAEKQAKKQNKVSKEAKGGEEGAHKQKVLSAKKEKKGNDEQVQSSKESGKELVKEEKYNQIVKQVANPGGDLQKDDLLRSNIVTDDMQVEPDIEANAQTKSD